MTRDLDSIRKAVLRTYGSRLLNVHDASCARGVFAMTATQAGIPLVQIADALGCTHATAVNAHMVCLRNFEEGDRQIREDVAKVELILDEQLVSTPIANNCDGAISPSRITADWWTQIAVALGRPLNETTDGLLECDPIIEAYESIAGQLVPSAIVRTISVPTICSDDDRVLELSFRSLAVDHYAAGETPTWEVVLDAALVPANGKEEAA